MRAVVRSPSLDPTARQWLVLALTWGVIATVLVARAGLYPAVMTGDEIWFSESALNFLTHGVPRRLIHADLVGSAQADFLPPIIMLVQAVAFRLLGVTPLAVAAQSILAPLAVITLVFVVARRSGAALVWAGCASVAVLGSQIFLRAGLYIRYESLVTIWFLLYLLATRFAQDSARAWAWHGLRGFAVALAGLSYYPLAPFVGLAALLFETTHWRRVGDAARHAERLLMMAAGFALPAALFGLYVARYPDEFAAQVLGNGSSNYLTFELLSRPFDPALWRQSKDALLDLSLFVGFLVLGATRLRREGGWFRCLYAAALITSLPLLIYPFQLRLLALPMTLLLIALAAWSDDRAAWLRRLARSALVAGAGAGLVSCVLLMITTAVQHDARRYDGVAAALDRLIVAPGPAAIDQRAWLALRADQPTRELHHVMPAWAPDQVRIFESALLRNPQGGPYFRYVVLNAADADATILATPALAQAFLEHRFTEIGRIRPPFQALPWAGQPPYDLVVYARRE